jgi:diguanylate cyclase (GGDEF)-like protein
MLRLACWLLLTLLLIPVASLPARAAVPAGAAAVVVDVDRFDLTRHWQVLADRDGVLDGPSLLDDEPRRHGFVPLAERKPSANFGRTASVMWFTATLRGASGDGDRLRWLEIGYPSLDRVDLWLRLPDGSVRHQVSGDLLAMAERPIAHRALLFPIELPASGDITVLARLETKGTLSGVATLWRPDALAQHDQKVYGALAFYFGLVAALLLYNLLLYVALRERDYLIYVGFVAAMALGQLGITGFGAQFLWPDWPTWSHLGMFIGLAASGLMGQWFAIAFLDLRRTMPRVWVVSLGFMAVFGAALAMIPWWTREAGVLMNGAAGLAAITSLLAAVVSLWRGHREARYFLLAWGMLLLAVLIGVFHSSGWLPSNFVTTNALMVGSAFEMLLLSFALADRIDMTRRDKEAAQAQALAAGQAMLESLRQTERELDERVTARTQEFARVNAQLLQNERELKRLAHQDPLTGLPNRKLFLDRLAHAIERSQRLQVGFALLIIDLDGFKGVNDTHGHAAGDEMLVEVAHRLSETVRGSDSIARWGGDEFVVLLEGVRDARAAWPTVAKLRAVIAQPVVVAGCASAQVGASIGVACYPRDGEDAKALLDRADQAMYLAKAESRQGRSPAAPEPVRLPALPRPH